MSNDQSKPKNVRYVPETRMKVFKDRIKRLLGIKKRGPYAR